MSTHRVRLSRRAVLRGLGFAGIAIGLPPLESMVGQGSVAHAAPGAVADRFVLFHFNHGAYMADWVPQQDGALGTLSDQLQPLAAYKSDIRVVSGLSSLAGTEPGGGDGNPHIMPSKTFLTGMPARTGANGSVGGPSIDQRVAQLMAGRTRIASLVVAPYVSMPISYAGPFAPQPVRTDPKQLFKDLFLTDAEKAAYASLLSRRKSILDFVGDDVSKLQTRVSAADRARLEQHLASIRAVEASLSPNAGTCATPAPFPSVTESDADLDQKAKTLIDMSLLALECDITRVLLISASPSFGVRLLPFLTSAKYGVAPSGAPPTDDHQASHMTLGTLSSTITDPLLRAEYGAYWYKRSTAWKVGLFARLLDRLKTTISGGDTMLKRTVLACASELSFGEVHCCMDLPVVVAGALVQGGSHVRFPCDANAAQILGTTLAAATKNQRLAGIQCAAGGGNTPLSNLWLTALHAFGFDDKSFGESTGALPGLWA